MSNSLSVYVDSMLSRGKTYFSRAEAMVALKQSPEAFKKASARLIKKQRLACPRRGFYLILRPEDRAFGAPDPARWIGPLMKHLRVDYRISLLRAAAFHGSSHQAAMVFQVIAPKQIHDFEIGRHRIQFIYQAPEAFKEANRPEWLDAIKTDTGMAKVAGVELTLLDSSRYFHKAAGINGLAQIVHDIGGKAKASALANAAMAYENSAVRRLGYLLDRFGHNRQAKVLHFFADQAKSLKPLDPSARAIAPELGRRAKRNSEWKLVVNTPVEIDA
ncbi:MAG: type IV toxin-antitoxin system AbiEi family antitoxin [Pirellulales bacterium]|nr:type IV toxin-antitoxin system AbiEi family antitoxin [Pirellulales bacterium]